MKIGTLKYAVVALAFIGFALCFFPMMSGRLDDGEACTAVLSGVNFAEFSAVGIVILIAPLLVPVILFGCQSRWAKELELILLLTGNVICFVRGANAARAWLLEIGAVYEKMNIALLLYPVIFALLCFLAIVGNMRQRTFYMY